MINIDWKILKALSKVIKIKYIFGRKTAFKTYFIRTTTFNGWPVLISSVNRDAVDLEDVKGKKFHVPSGCGFVAGLEWDQPLDDVQTMVFRIDVYNRPKKISVAVPNEHGIDVQHFEVYEQRSFYPLKAFAVIGRGENE